MFCGSTLIVAAKAWRVARSLARLGPSADAEAFDAEAFLSSFAAGAAETSEAAERAATRAEVKNEPILSLTGKVMNVWFAVYCTKVLILLGEVKEWGERYTYSAGNLSYPIALPKIYQFVGLALAELRSK